MFYFSRTPINGDELKQAFCSTTAGAVVTFAGIVRDHHDGRRVLALEYEAYEELAMAEAAKIFSEAQEQFDILEASCVHRLGKLTVGEMAVWVGVSATHRDGAFAACQYMIDEIKKRLPIWKKEYYTDRDSRWVNCHLTAFPHP